MSAPRDNRLLSFYESSVRIAFPFLAGIAAWTLTSVIDIDRRVTKIEASRYTTADAKADRESTTSVLNDIRVQVAVGQATQNAILDRLVKIDGALERLADRTEKK